MMPSDSHLIVVKPSKGWISLKLKELWEYRELLYFMAWRDIRVRYKQTVLGAAWAIIQPFFTMVVFSIFFGKLAKVPSDGLPYPIFAYAALVPWTFFANGLNQASNSLVGSANLIKKVYFPRLVVPIFVGDDAVLRNSAHGEHLVAAAFCIVDLCHCLGGGILAFGTECPVS
jgi:lipopolysaccharide transport system permease protein